MTHDGADEVNEELQHHLQMDVAARVSRGESTQHAAYAARRAFGNLTQVAEVTREARRGPWQAFADAAHDLRLAFRRVLRAPLLAVAIALTLGLGLGGAAAIITVSRAALVGQLPYTEADRLIHLWEMRTGNGERSPTSHATLTDLRTRSSRVESLEGYDPSNLTVGVGDEARMLRGAQVTPGFFRTLGVRPAVGADFRMEGSAAGDTDVAIVTERFTRLYALVNALGQRIVVNGVTREIVGVLPATFHFALLQDADVFIPLAETAGTVGDRADRALSVIGRLRRGVEVPSANAELTGVMTRLAAEYPNAMAGRTVAVVSLRDALTQDVKPMLTALLVAVALLLTIVAANLASLMLSRFIARLPELTMRAALGASRARLARQLFVESLVPSLLGATLAIAVGQATTVGIVRVVPDNVKIGMPYLTSAGLGWTEVVAILALTVALAVAFGLVPGLIATRAESGRPLAGDSRSTYGRGERRLRRGLVIAQLAVTVVLLNASGLLLLSFNRLIHRDLGVRDPATLVTARMPLAGDRYAEPQMQRQFYTSVVERVSALPGVGSAAVIDEVPGGGGGATTFEPVDRPRPPTERSRVAVRTIGKTYFETMGILATAGRAFDTRDRDDSPPVAVVSASFARILELDGSVIGRRLRLARTDTVAWEVIGVVGDVQVATMDADSPPVIYLSQQQSPENRMTLVVRTALSAPIMESALREIIKSLDPGVPVYAVSSLAQQLRHSRAVFSRQLPLVLCGVFAVAALLLTLIAVYATCAHDVLTRRREFGIRIALGGTAATIRRLLFSDAIRLAAIGVVVGSGTALVSARLIESVLFGATGGDWRVYLAVALGLAAVTLAVTSIPAQRAGAMNAGDLIRME